MIPVKYNVRSLRARWVASLMTIMGTALVVWASVLAFGLAAGLEYTLNVSGEPLDMILLRKGATAETGSSVDEATARRVAALSGLATDDEGNTLVSPELVVIVNTARRGDGGKANVIIRGVTPVARKLRSEFKLVEGRDMKPGVREALTSRSIAGRFQGAGLGEEIDLLGQKFKIVGLFEAGGGSAESEVWTDVEVLSQTSKREGGYSCVQLRTTGRESMTALADLLENDEQFALKAVSEQKYFAEQSSAGIAIKIVGRVISVFLTIGAMFAVANTMYGAVASRAREIGTLRALGFARRTIVGCFLLESILLCLAGGLLGCLGTLPFNGLSTGTANWDTFSEITFSFRFGPDVLLQGALLAMLMGVVGGMAPAIRAVRIPIVNALREI